MRRAIRWPSSAISAWHRALEHDPSDVAARLDIGDASLDLGNFRSARESYANALELAPEHEWALPSWLFARWKETGDREARDRLHALAQSAAPDSRAFHMAELAFPYLLSLEPPRNSIVHMARDVLAKGGSMTRLGVSGMEAPSILAALVDACHRAGKPPPDVEFAEIPRPDPRVPMPGARVERTLWSYSLDGFLSRFMTRLGTQARPAVARPESPANGIVTQLASMPYALDAWTEAAISLSAELEERDIDSLLATMVHIPELPVPADAWTHRFQRQVAAAFLVSQVGDDWEGSARRAALADLLFGPVDWTTTAAIIATCNLGRIEPDLREGVLDLLLPLLNVGGGAIHYANIAEPLAACITWIPNTPPEIEQWVHYIQSAE